jgi:hypothetical protein
MPEDFGFDDHWKLGAEACAIGLPYTANPFVNSKKKSWFTQCATSWWAGYWDARQLLRNDIR